MTRWQYKIVPITGPQSAVSPDEDFIDNEVMLNVFGELGWELVTIYKTYFLFKKPC